MESIAPKIISDIGWGIGTLVVITVILHLFLLYPKNLTKRQWKKVDYVWLLFTSVGLIGAIQKVDLRVSQSNRFWAEQKINVAYTTLTYDMGPGHPQYICRTFVRSEYSPPDLEEVQNEYDRACKWKEQVYETILAAQKTEDKEVNLDSIPPLYSDEATIMEYRDLLKKQIKEYNAAILELRACVTKIRNYENDELTFFMPLVLILGLSLRITKVTGELLLEKRNSEVGDRKRFQFRNIFRKKVTDNNKGPLSE